MLSIIPTELPEALKRKVNSRRNRVHKKHYGQSISHRPEIAGLCMEEGRWEGDTVVGKRAGKEAVILSLLEKKTQTYLALRISDKTRGNDRTSQRIRRALWEGIQDHYRGQRQ